MTFGTVAIVGMGQIGGSIGMALLRRKLTRCVIGIDRDPAVLRAAKARRACTMTAQDLAAVALSDLVVLAAPVRGIRGMAKGIRFLLPHDAIATDVGSAKAAIMKDYRGLRGFVGGHPMAGTEKAGIAAADPRLFEGATWVLVPGDRRALPKLTRLVRVLGASPLVMTAAAHDRAVATTSHLPYLFALALKAAARDRRLAAGSFRSATRVAAQAPEMARDFLLANRFHVAAAADRMAAAFKAIAGSLRKGDEAAVKRFQKKGMR